MHKKALFFIFFTLVIFTFLSAYRVNIILHTEEQIDGDLVGKRGENIFVVESDRNIVIPKTSIYQIKNHDRVITDYVYSIDDWIDPIYMTSLFVPYREERQDLVINEELLDIPQFRTEEMIIIEFTDPFYQIQTHTIAEGEEIKNPTKKDIFWTRMASLLTILLFILFCILEVF